MTNLLLVTSNGTGMGHLTRQVAVALSTGSDHSATLFSLSLGLPLATGLGVPGEYCPSYDRPWIASRDWHAYLRDRLLAIVEETDSDAVLFDGVAPYPGIALAASQLREVAFIWLRRGMWQPNTNKAQLRKARNFDLIIEPGDLGEKGDEGPTAGIGDAVPVGPISILEALPTIPRVNARETLGLPQDTPVALVTLGSGRLGAVAEPGRVAVETLLASPDWHVVVTRSPVAVNEIPMDQASRLTELSGVYPLAPYMPAFDLAVSSAGYNAAHELIPAGVPTLFVANTSTRTDDQIARARQLDREGYSKWARDDDAERLRRELTSLLEESTRSELASRMTEAPLVTGASETASVAAAFAAGFDRRRKTAREVLSEGLFSAKEAGKQALGEKRTSTIKRWLGRQPSAIHERTTVRVTEQVTMPSSGPLPLAFVEEVTGEDLRAEVPIEHLLGGSSAEYKQRRRDLVDAYYDVAG